MGRVRKNRQSKNRFVLSLVGSEQIAFPSELVGEIISVDRSTVLPLPFYSDRCLGVVHHRGNTIPLCTLNAEPLKPGHLQQGTIAAIRLSDRAGVSAGVGICIDRLLGQISKQALIQGGEMENDLSGLNSELQSPALPSTESSDLDAPEIPWDWEGDAAEQPDNTVPETSTLFPQANSSTSTRIFSIDEVPDDIWIPYRPLVAASSPPT